MVLISHFTKWNRDIEQRCKNEKCQRVIIENKSKSIKTIYNRDANSVSNMLSITKNLIKTGLRSKEFIREIINHS